QHSEEELEKCEEINDQLELRRRAVLEYLEQIDKPVISLSAIAARGGVIGKLNCGAYLIDESLVRASINSPAPHAANIAPVIAYELAQMAGIKAYIYDAVCGCGNPQEVFTITGMPEIKKHFLTHLLNSRAVAIKQAQEDGKELSKTTYIVAHLGGGITVNLIHKGEILDIIGDDEGTFSPERSGGLPCRPLVKLCYSGKYSEKEVQRKMKGQGGLKAYLGTNDLKEVEDMIAKGNKKAEICYQAMAMQVAKDIGSLSTVTEGVVDRIILTGGLAYSKMFTDLIIKRTKFIAPVSVIPGTCEMQALALGVYRVLNGEEKASRFIPEDYHI
ncbi:MAG: butyrate kinase, partial [Clostridiaceae bacterium]|nr:butyrate kinase [Clostridiaceae bacterium]